jgi:amidase
MDGVFMGATQLAGAIRTGEVSATDALAAHLSQIERHNPALNAIVTLDADGAVARAREADAALARGEVWGPLHGVPFTLKDAHATAGLRTTVGFPPLAAHLPREDGTVAARLKGAGGILLGKTNVPTMLADFQTANPIFGGTNNPWDLGRTPGGSSGGAAAAVAAGMTPFDIGTDLSGSIRIPAHFCGVCGLKPTEGRVSLNGVIPDPADRPRGVRLMSCVGPLARTVEGLALLCAIIAGSDGHDTGVPPVPVVAPPPRDVSGLRIAVASTMPGLPIAAATRAAIERLAAQLAAAGAIAEEIAPPIADLMGDLASAGELIGMMVGASEGEGGAGSATLARYMATLQRRDRAIVAWEDFFASWDALLCPASMSTAFPHCEPGAPLRVDDLAADYWAVSVHSTIFSYIGLPAVVLPHTQDRDGLPLGVQLVGKRWGESELLAVARALAPCVGAFRRPPGY